MSLPPVKEEKRIKAQLKNTFTPIIKMINKKTIVVKPLGNLELRIVFNYCNLKLVL